MASKSLIWQPKTWIFLLYYTYDNFVYVDHCQVLKQTVLYIYFNTEKKSFLADVCEDAIKHSFMFTISSLTLRYESERSGVDKLIGSDSVCYLRRGVRLVSTVNAYRHLHLPIIYGCCCCCSTRLIETSAPTLFHWRSSSVDSVTRSREDEQKPSPSTSR